jgi:hypothetical protein
MLLRRAGTQAEAVGPGSAAHRRTRAKRDPESAAQHPGNADRYEVPHPCTIRHAIAPNAPAHSAIAASAWIAKPRLRFATACA